MAKRVKKIVKVARRNVARSKSASTPREVRPAARVSVAVDKDLLARAEQHAKARGTTVALLVTEGLLQVVGAAKAPVLPPGDVPNSPAADAGPWGQLLAWMEEQQTTLTEIRDALGDVAAFLPSGLPPGENRSAPGPRIPPV